MIFLFLIPSTVYSLLFFDPLIYYRNDSIDPAGVILSQSDDPPSLWEMVKNETIFQGNSTISKEFDEASGSLSLNTIGVVKRDTREGNERDTLFEEWNNLLKVLNISDSNDSTSSNNSKSDLEIHPNDIFTHHWTLERLL